MNARMMNNYLVTALRVLEKNRLYSALNIVGLAASLSCAILILLFVQDELSYERWLPDGERIYRMESTFFIPGREPLKVGQSPGPARAALEKHFPSEIEQAVRVYRRRPTFDIGERQFNDDWLEVDPEFFRVFPLEFIAGDPETALGDTSSVVLTESIARKYFGDQPALGRTLTVTREAPEAFRVSGVVRDLPGNSHLELNMLTRFDPPRYADRPWVADRWTSVNMSLYIKFRSVEAAERAAAGMKEFVNRNVNFGMPELEGVAPGDLLTLALRPVPDIHLYGSDFPAGFKPGGDIVTVWTFSAVALLILLIASINFMNLATARSLQRAREVSMRKVLGATRAQLVVQFLGESLLLTFLALVLAVIAVELLLPWYNGYIDKQLGLDFIANPQLGLALLGLTLLIGVGAGLYPALVLSGFRPAAVLKANQSGAGGGSAGLRAALVVFQFAISIGLIATTLVIWAQTRYAMTLDTGYTRDHMVMIDNIGDDETKALQPTMLAEFGRIPGVQALGRASDSFPQESSNNTLVSLPDVPSDDLMVVETMNVDYDLFPTVGVQPVAGRLFSRDFPGDVLPAEPDEVEGPVSVGVILNERAVRRLGFGSSADAVGRTFELTVGEEKKATATVVGVVRDLHLRSVREEISPMLYFVMDDAEGLYYLFLHLRSDGLPETLAAIDSVWQRLVPAVPISRNFVDEEFAKLYRAERERMKMFGGFAVFAVFVACLGLFGLASFAADRRTKEIGVRKVLGATAGRIVGLLVWQFSRPVLIANLVAWPAAWLFLDHWLRAFQFRVDVTPLPFLAAGGAALLIAWLTVIVHARRVSTANPVHALRYE